jgi:hypothetical protein
MSSLDTAAPFAYPSSTLLLAQLPLLDLLVTPQQKLVKSTCSFLRKQLSPALRASDSTFVKRLLTLPPTSFLSLSATSSPLIVTLKTPRPSGNSKKLFSISAAHTLCHRVPKAVGISLSSDLSTALAIQASPLVSTPNIPLDSSFHQVLLICLLPKPVTTRPILLNDTSEQVEDPSTVKTSLPAIICFHLCFYPIVLITSKSNKL